MNKQKNTKETPSPWAIWPSWPHWPSEVGAPRTASPLPVHGGDRGQHRCPPRHRPSPWRPSAVSPGAIRRPRRLSLAPPNPSYPKSLPPSFSQSGSGNPPRARRRGPSPSPWSPRPSSPSSSTASSASLDRSPGASMPSPMPSSSPDPRRRSPSIHSPPATPASPRCSPSPL